MDLTDAAALLQQQNLVLHVGGGAALDVRSFEVRESMSSPFEVVLTAVSPSVDVDFEAAIGTAARFELHRFSAAVGDIRYWSGVCTNIQQVAVEADGLSTYAVTIRPHLWLLSQRRTYRIFQDKSELDIVLEVLGGWGISPRLDLDAGSYAKRRYRAQYAESDLTFISRLLEDIGVTYFFVQDGGESKLVLADAPNRAAPRAPLPFISAPTKLLKHEYVTKVVSSRQVRPGRYTQSDVDYRRPADYPLAASAKNGTALEASLERYHHNYGSFLWKGQGGGTPHADDRGAARTSEELGGAQVGRRLEAQRADARVCTFVTTAYDLQPGSVLAFADHPRSELAAPLLVVASTLVGTSGGDWDHHCEARFAEHDFRPALVTPKPRTNGVESATVTGPAGEEIHTDEFGRVRVHFHWDREGASDEQSSLWIPVSQPWAGAGMGAISLPRVGQEVIVDFLGADPDRPVVLGSVFTTTMPPPYKLPDLKMVSGMRSERYPRRKAGGAQMGGGPDGVATLRPSGPAGGGPKLVAQLGGFDGLPPLLGNNQTFNPGAFGASPAPLDESAATLAQNLATGPDGQDRYRDTNAIVMNDTADQEQLSLQAQKDLMCYAKENFSGTVGANQAFDVHGNDTLTCQGFQSLSVGQDRNVEVVGNQTHTVHGETEFHALKNHKLVVTEQASSEARAHVQISKEGAIFNVVDSTILMLPGALVIQSQKVFINPGLEFLDVLARGGTIEEAMAAQAAADAARAEAAYQEKLAGLRDPAIDYFKRHDQDIGLGAFESDAPSNWLSQQYAEALRADPNAISPLGEQLGGIRNSDLAGLMKDANPNLPPLDYMQ